MFDLKTRHAISSAVNFYNAVVVTRDRRIGSCDRVSQRRRCKNRKQPSEDHNIIYEYVKYPVWAEKRNFLNTYFPPNRQNHNSDQRIPVCAFEEDLDFSLDSCA
jgi:hypothetical protein